MDEDSPPTGRYRNKQEDDSNGCFQQIMTIHFVKKTINFYAFKGKD